MTHKGPLVRKRPRKRNRDGTWRKKRSDTGKKREKIMSNNARDEQFKGFANAVYMECFNIAQEAMLSNRIDTDQRVIQHIARRAYDLAKHIIDNSRSNDMEDWETDKIMPYVPDMPELPKEQGNE